MFTTLNPTAQALVTNARGVNNNGIVVGFYADNNNATAQHGFLYNTSSKMFTLIADPTPVLSTGQSIVLTQFLGINVAGLTSGYYQTTDGSQHGFIYDTTKDTYTFLDDPNAPTSGFSITQITGINDSDELSGFYIDASGVQHGFVAPVPLPSAAWSSLLTLVGIGVVAKGRRALVGRAARVG
jgi:probable HAF family extracellular repeat protein